MVRHEKIVWTEDVSNDRVGASFQKRKFTFGIGSGYELIRLTLNEAGDRCVKSHHHKPVEG